MIEKVSLGDIVIIEPDASTVERIFLNAMLLPPILSQADVCFGLALNETDYIIRNKKKMTMGNAIAVMMGNKVTLYDPSDLTVV